MTEKDFVNIINRHYSAASQLLEGNGGYDIYRGTAHPISGYLEDVFALYMAKRINRKNLQFLVDKLISSRSEKSKRAITFKPDLAILDNSRLTHYYDLKTNLGWNRDLNKYLIQKNELINSIKGKKGWITFPKVDKDNPAIRQEVDFDENLKYKIVIFNGWNINKKMLDANLSLSSTLENIEMYILNEWDDKTRSLKMDKSAFTNLY